MENINTMSKTYQYRKIKKPMLERKRRARINKCLDELKDLMIETMSQSGDNVNRLEKADILELTVEHLKNLKTKRPSVIKQTPIAQQTDSFREGYVQAANEVSKTLASLPNIDINLGTKIMTHLGHRLVQIQDDSKKQIPQQQQKVNYLSMKSSSYYDSYRSNTSSPAASSGYGSDIENYPIRSPVIVKQQVQAQIPLSTNQVWRPW